MLERVITLKPFIDVDHDDFIQEDELDRNHFSIARLLVRVLKPLRDMQLFLEGQRYVTLSWVPSFLEGLRADLTAMHSDLGASPSNLRLETRSGMHIAGATRNAIMAGLEAMVYHFRGTDERFVYRRDGLTEEGRLTGVPTAAWLASVLDPRTKDLLSFLSADETEQLWYMLIVKMGKQHDADRAANPPIQQIEFCDTDDDDVSTEMNLDEAKRQKTLLHNDMVDSVVRKFSQSPQRHQEPHSRLQERIDDVAAMKTEIHRYRNEPRLGPDRNPLEWWKENELKYPHIAKMAKKYLAIQATNASSERMNSTLSLTVRANRASLTTDSVGDIHTLREFFLWSESNPAAYHEFLASQ